MRTLHADAYDTLELTSLAFGGIGGGWYVELDEDEREMHDAAPLCAIGHACFADSSTEVLMALGRISVGTVDSDIAVARINRRRGRGLMDRVPFDQWCKELGVVRGE